MRLYYSAVTARSLKLLPGDSKVRPAAQRTEAFKARYAFKAGLDDDARKLLFPQNAWLVAWHGEAEWMVHQPD